MRARLFAVTLLLPVVLLGCVPDPADNPPQTGGGNGGDVVPNTPPEKPFDLPLSREEAASGWIALFDGESLFGWKANNDVDWAVEDGTITASEGEPGLLLTTVPFADFRLHCEFRLEAGGNSGVFLRTVFDPTDPTTDCYEFNLCDTHEAFPTGSLVGRKATKRSLSTENDEWHTVEVHCEGPNVFGYIDGELVIEYFDKDTPDLRSGLIGLQKNAGRVAFRNVRLRPVVTRTLFDGETLDGWREVPANLAKFEVATKAYAPPGEDSASLGTRPIRVTGGPGFLETEDSFGNFLLQFDARTNEPRVNSGVFFRAQPGSVEEPSNGYELQIHSGVADGDRTKPNDYGDGFGTGAIFRRQPARVVVSDDGRWSTITLVANGNRFATWVDGYQVVDFVDDREPDPNPRKGRRDEAGHISLQGHDESTTVDFRNFDVSDYPE